MRRLQAEFANEIDWRLVMGGLGRDYKGHERGALATWTIEAGEVEMPMDPLLWNEGGISSSYPACIAVKAASEQGADAGMRYLRVLREGLMCFRRRLDSLEPFVEEARRIGLDVERFRVDAASHAMVEAFGADLELVRAVPEGSPREDRVPFPTLRVGESDWFFGRAEYETVASALEAAGATRSPGPPSVGAAFERFERLAVKEVELLCDLPGPRAHAELWRLAAEWRVKPLRSLTGYLFERA